MLHAAFAEHMMCCILIPTHKVLHTLGDLCVRHVVARNISWLQCQIVIEAEAVSQVKLDIKQMFSVLDEPRIAHNECV